MLDKVGRYEAIYPLAQGGMAEVWVGRMPGMAGFEKLVAIKLIHAHLSKEKQFIRMFLDEARLAASIRHPNVAEIYEVGKEGDLYYMVGELVLGQNLHVTARKARQDGAPISEALAAYIVSQACQGLHEAHEQRNPDGKYLGLVHRDVTPRNILLSYGGFVKIADFGVAWASEKLAHSEVGSVKGKIGFMAPEQIRCQPLDRRCDIFALGVVFYMLLTGKHPFHSENDAATLNNIVTGNLTRPSEIAPDISPDIESIVMTALANSPEDRYQSAAEMHEDLEESIEVHGYKASPGPLSRTMHQIFRQEIEDHDRKVREYRRDRGEDTGITSVPPPPPEGMTQPSRAIRAAPVAYTEQGLDTTSVAGRFERGGTDAGAAGGGRRFALLGAGFAALAAVIVALVIFFSGFSADRVDDVPPAIAAPEPAPTEPPPAPVPAEAPEETPKAPTEIRLDLGALPMGAEVFLDNEAITYPFAVKPSAEPAVLLVEAPGYLPFEVTIPLDRDREVAVLLEREKPKPKFGIMPRPPVNETGPGSTTGDAAKKPPVESKVLLPSPFD